MFFIAFRQSAACGAQMSSSACAEVHDKGHGRNTLGQSRKYKNPVLTLSDVGSIYQSYS